MRPFSTVRKLRDSAQSAEDRYNNTGTDEQYISRVGGTDATALLGDVGMGAGVVGMARSLSDVYRPEVVEDVGKKFNGMYR